MVKISISTHPVAHMNVAMVKLMPLFWLLMASVWTIKTYLQVTHQHSLLYTTNVVLQQFHRSTGCTHVIVPSSQLVAIATMISSNVSTLHLVGKNDPNSAERFYFNETDQPANSSFCHIASLEVFRGWEQAIQISHDGFSLSDNSTVKVKP